MIYTDGSGSYFLTKELGDDIFYTWKSLHANATFKSRLFIDRTEDGVEFCIGKYDLRLI